MYFVITLQKDGEIFVDCVENILRIAKEKKYTNKMLCEILNKNPSYITDWKNGKSKPKADEIVLLAEIFKVSTDFLLTGRIIKNNSDEEQEILNMYNSLTYENKIIAKHEIKKLVQEQKLREEHPKSSA